MQPTILYLISGWKTLEKSEVNYFVSANPANLFILQQKSSLTEFQEWKTEVHIPGFFALYKCISEPPLLKMIRKIFVVDSCSYTPCKSLILYPFHEFS
jgi:hypothetical protein